MGARTDDELLGGLRDGDAAAFREIVVRYHALMVRVAETYVPGRAVAEEVAQDTWLAVIRGIDRFEGRSSFKTWLLRILTNQAKSRGERERRTIPFSAFDDELTSGPSVAPERFIGPAGRGAWAQPPAPWSDQPDEVLASKDTLALVGGV